jgi:alkylhydroperoxidase family enzyme
MSEPRWHDNVPDRTRDPSIKRPLRHRVVIGGAKRLTRGRSYKFMQVLSINKRLFRPFIAYNARLMPYGTLPRTDTEALILRTATVCGSRYEWKQHEEIGKSVGLTDEQIELITNDPQSAELGEPMRLLMTAAKEILEDRVLTDATFDGLRKSYTHAQVLELTMLVGNYAMLAGALNTFGVTLESAWAQ